MRALSVPAFDDPATLREARLGVVGATGAVGRELLGLLAADGVPAAHVRAFASERSAGRRLAYADGTLAVEPLADGALDELDGVLLVADAATARAHAPRALEAGAWVIDNSSAFRMAPEVPLVVPEINGAALAALTGPVLVANPNCTTILVLMAIAPLRAAFGCRRALVSTYQAVSGAGLPAIDELLGQTRAVLAGEEPVPSVFAEPCAFNVFPHDAPTDPETGDNGEETKVMHESRRILGDPAFAIAATCVRVPVLRAHCASVQIELERPARVDEARARLEGAPGVMLVDERERARFPTSRRATGRREVLVGRLRADPTLPTTSDGRHHGLLLFCATDQLLKGAAWNALQIARALAAR